MKNSEAQASVSAAIQKEIADKQAGTAAPALPSFGVAPKNPSQDAAASKPEPVCSPAPHCPHGICSKFRSCWPCTLADVWVANVKGSLSLPFYAA